MIMNKPVADYKFQPRHIDLGARQAVTVRAERGSEVRVASGQVWITQEGDHEDYIVSSGTRFCSGRKGNIVVSALSEASRITVSWTDPARSGGYARSGVWLDYAQIERIEQAARRARAREIVGLFGKAVMPLKRAWRTLTRRRLASRLATR
jgi:hypothetical protein